MRSLLVLALWSAAACAAEPLQLLDHRAAAPAAWRRVPPSSAYRLAQFVVDGEAGGAEAAVFHFGGRDGGSAEANIARWSGQFSGADGRPVAPAVRRYATPAGPATSALLEGTYARGVGSGPQGEGRPGQALYAVVVEADAGRLIFQLWGARAVVLAQRGALDALIAGMTPAAR